MTIKLDETGRLAFPAEVAARFGLEPGAPVEVEEEAGSLRLRRPVTHLAKLYIEPTVRCNLNCRTCLRNVWDDPGGDMTGATFAAVIAGLRSFIDPPTVFFGGFGEPLAHPGSVDMAAAAKALGLNDHERFSRRYIVGKLAEHSLGDLWYAPEHIAFRQCVRAFDFSPCTFCGGCDYSLANEEDCFGNPFPTCGGCLWAQGVIRCP